MTMKCILRQHTHPISYLEWSDEAIIIDNPSLQRGNNAALSLVRSSNLTSSHINLVRSSQRLHCKPRSWCCHNKSGATAGQIPRWVWEPSHGSVGHDARVSHRKRSGLPVGGGREKWLLICLRLVADVHWTDWQYWSAADRLGALVILWSWEPNHVRDGHDLRVSHRKRSEDARGSDMGGIAGLFRPWWKLHSVCPWRNTFYVCAFLLVRLDEPFRACTVSSGYLKVGRKPVEDWDEEVLRLPPLWLQEALSVSANCSNGTLKIWGRGDLRERGDWK